jgi:hypothetical protein
MAGSREGVLVQPMISGGVELMIGITQDPSFGPLIGFGLGGMPASSRGWRRSFDGSNMISVRRIQIGEGDLFKRIRLASLRESPSAFASTYESALNRSSESWSEQADSTAQGSDRSTFIAFSGDSPIGIAAL